jgi:agmatinase
MYNVLEDIKQVTKLVQIGIRDYCEEELNRTEERYNPRARIQIGKN